MVPYGAMVGTVSAKVLCPSQSPLLLVAPKQLSQLHKLRRSMNHKEEKDSMNLTHPSFEILGIALAAL